MRFNLHFYVQHRELKGRTRDVPRLRGEKQAADQLDRTFVGSPPLTRGKADADRNEGRASGITPAYAGKRNCARTARPPDGDHPRLRGEKSHPPVRTNSYPGSPPLTRGKADAAHNHKDQSGITPAYAGKSAGMVLSSGVSKDHPRLRGEKASCEPGSCEPAGSPPLTRGKASAPSWGAVAVGITPAYAGKSAVGRRRSPRPRDHPRLRGEKLPPLGGGCRGWDHPRLRGEKRVD